MVSSLLGVGMALFTNNNNNNLLIILGFGLATNLSEDSEDGDSIQEIKQVNFQLTYFLGHLLT